VLGTIVGGKYQIERLLGAGAMGSVYEAQHTGTGRRVAVKVIASGDLARDKMLVARFQREAKAAGAVDTQHITQVLDTGLDDATGMPFMVMEFLNGEDLSQLITRLGPLPPDLALRLVAQTCLGLQKAHEANVIHRDIKPANLFLAQRDAGERIVKVLDFGVAKVKMEHASDGDGMDLTKTGSMLGSPLYMSPEQAKGLKTIDHRVDLWSLGVVLYKALSGQTPYDHCESLGGLIIAVCHEDIVPVQQIAPWVSPEIAAVVHRALQRDPNQRFSSAKEMFDAIRPLLPNGWTLNDDLLVPLSDEVKGTAVRQASVRPPPMRGPAGGMPPPRPMSYPPPSMPGLPPLGPGTFPTGPGLPMQAPALAGGSTTGALVQSQPGRTLPPPAPARSPVPILVGALLVVGVLAGGAIFFIRGTGRDPAVAAPQPSATPTASAAPTATAPSAPTATAAAPSATAVAAATKRVKVVVLPNDASVEVDGTRTPVRAGLLEISGAVGSVHKVRVFKGKTESLSEVTVTEDGANPPKVELWAKH
jgi:serine/threonine-protein kinase